MPDPLSSSNYGNVCFHFHINGYESQPFLRNRVFFQQNLNLPLESYSPLSIGLIIVILFHFFMN